MNKKTEKELPPNLRELSDELLKSIHGGAADACTSWPESTYVRRIYDAPAPAPSPMPGGGGASLSDLIDATLK